MKSIKRALCSVLICFGTFLFCTGTANAAESAEVSDTKAADNNFVDNNVTENIVASQETQDNKETPDDKETAAAEEQKNVYADASGVPADTQEITGAPETRVEESVQAANPDAAVYDVKQAADIQEITIGGAKESEEKKYNKAELRLMAAIIYCEANVEPYAGKLGVGIVIMNRVKSKSFPNTIKRVIYQKSQFSPVRNGSLKKALARYDAGKFKSKNERQCIKAAKAALDGVKSVSYGGRKNMEKYHYFSGSLKGSKLKIKGHKFK